jgi:hypothetical protein
MRAFTLKSMAMFTLLLTFSLNSQAECWQGITPLQSTRADVERLLGKPLPGEVSSSAVYRLEVGEVHIRYAASRLCGEPDRCECRVPDDTVIDISVDSQVKAKFSSLNIDKRAFERFPLVENTNITIYRNAVAGVVYAVSEKEDKILYVQYAPAEKDCQRILKKAP